MKIVTESMAITLQMRSGREEASHASQKAMAMVLSSKGRLQRAKRCYQIQPHLVRPDPERKRALPWRWLLQN